jgi:DHA1 family tetracycline resistance protein-like MFS transporter
MPKDKKQAALGFIFITMLIDVTGFGIIIPVVPRLIMQLEHCTNSEASRYGGLLLSAYAVMQFIFAPVLGNLSDQFGRRPILLFSLFGFGIDYLLTGFAPNLYWLFAGRLIAGVTGASFSTASAYIADVSPPEKKAQNFGMIGAAFGIGFIVGPVLGGYLGTLGLRIPFFVAAGLALVNWLYGFFVLPESLPKENRRAFSWKQANPFGAFKLLAKYQVVAGLSICMCLLYIAAHAVQSNWTFYTIEKFQWSEFMIGISLAVVGVVVVAVQGGLTRITMPKLGYNNSVYVGLVLYAVGYLLFGIASASWMMFAIIIPYAMGGICQPALQGILSNHVPPNEQGALQGALTSLASFAAIIGPFIMTNVFSYFTSSAAPIHFPGAAMLLACLLTIISLGWAYRTLHLKVVKKVPVKQAVEA